MRARGFTLIEILLVLALFVAMLSLVGPALLHRIAPMTFDRTVEQLESALLLAREDARRTGAVVYVYAERGEIDRVTRLESRSTPIGDAPGYEPSLDAGPGAELGPMEFDEEQGRHLFTLPTRFRLDHEAPRFGPDDEDFLSGFGAADPATPSEVPPGMDGDPRAEMFGFDPDDSPSTPVLVLVCLPDGSLLMPGPMWLVDEDSRAAAIRVEGAIGVVRVVAVEPARTGSGFADEASDERLLDDVGPTSPAGVPTGAGP